jgi:hypothetical protein
VKGRAVLRCAVCHDDLASPRLVCPACRTMLHAECRSLVRRCPTLGCVGLVARKLAPVPQAATYRVLGCLIGCLATLAVLVVSLGSHWTIRPKPWLDGLRAQIHAVEPELLAYVRDIRSGKIAPRGDSRCGHSFAPPNLPSGGPPIESVETDASMNVIFVTDHWLNWEVGFEHRNGDASVCGREFYQTDTYPLFDGWWAFHDQD